MAHVLPSVSCLYVFFSLQGASPNAKEGRHGLSPLMAAVLMLEGDIQDSMIRLLLSRGARADAASGEDEEVWTALSAAAHLGRGGAARLILEAAPKAAAAGGRHAATPLMRAAAAGDAEMVRLILSTCESPEKLLNTRDLQGMSPLLRASELGHSDVVDALLSFGADPSSDSVQYRHSDRARESVRSEHGDAALERALVALRSDVGARRGATPLALAAGSGDLETIRWVFPPYSIICET